MSRLDADTRDARARLSDSWQIILFQLLIDALFVVYFVMWHGDPVKAALLETFGWIWMIAVCVPLNLVFIVALVVGTDWLAFGSFPKNRNLGLMMLLGLSLGFVLIGTSIVVFKIMGGMALISMPELIEDLVAMFRGFRLPKVQFKPTMLDIGSGLQALFWQGIVSGTEEGFKLALMLMVAVVLSFAFRKKGEKMSPMRKMLILAVALVSVGVFWDGLHGFHNYSSATEYASAFVAQILLGVTTFICGNPIPAIIAHWFYNVFAPLITFSLIEGQFALPVLVWVILSLFLVLSFSLMILSRRRGTSGLR